MKNSIANETTNTTMNNVKEETNMKNIASGTLNIYTTAFKAGVAGEARILDDNGEEHIMTVETEAGDTMPVIQMKLLIAAAGLVQNSQLEAFVPFSYIGKVSKETVQRWIRSGWRTIENKPMAHAELWRDLIGTLKTNHNKMSFHVWFMGDENLPFDSVVEQKSAELESVDEVF